MQSSHAVAIVPDSGSPVLAFAGTANAPAAITRHVTATTAVLTRVLASTLPSLQEPRTPDPELALRYLDYLVETLVGAAAGAVIGHVVGAIRRGLSRDIAHPIERQLREALRRIGPGRTTQRADEFPPALSDFVNGSTARTLVDELGARMLRRLTRASRDHQDVLTRVATAVPAERTASFLSALESLADDPMLSHVWSEHLVLAWCCYAAAISRVRDAVPAIPPPLAATTFCDTWRGWLLRVRGSGMYDAGRSPTSSLVGERFDGQVIDRGEFLMRIG